ncbi:MAG: citrate (Si)-synthase [Chloroflexi bacterium]|nr:citrate (Si)-synthase [Chloroflexota bacterium]MCH2524646.1 citrate (Si)-synthase [Dehalococcoidia bacterium]|tara:strand:- start:14499 stop:15647 length:1149 start_codon:yes stop_codon:yes gene_type:complete
MATDNTDDNNEPQIHRGLNGVYFDRSASSYIDGRNGILLYRGYSIHDLAAYSTFEEVSYLLLYGELPNQSELANFKSLLASSRKLPAPIVEIIKSQTTAHPMDAVRTATSALAAFDPDTNDNSYDATIRKGIRLTAQIPMIIAAHHRLRNNLPIIEPDHDLTHAANFLYMLQGEKPSAEAHQLMDTDAILHAEHGSNASSFTARVVAGTDANLHASITSAIAALSGPAHGGAAENVMLMAQEIGEPENAAEYVKNLRKNRKPVMGFGHRVYRTEDPRARHMRDGVERLSTQLGEPKWFQILQATVEAMAPYARLGVNVNVDFYAGVVYHLLGIPEDIFVPIFVMGRVPGWVAQVIEQQEHNILIRPLTVYNGPEPRKYPSGN